MITEFIESKFTDWPNIPFREIRHETFDFYIEQSIPYGVTNKIDTFQIIFSWRLTLISVKDRSLIFEAVYKTLYWIKGERSKEELLNLCQESYLKLSSAWRNRLKTQEAINPQIPPFDRNSSVVAVEQLLAKLESEHKDK